jgi:putative ABC transport system ATP-binding protein/macrolide transport system ATP-binding/permease protein/lipoprotein-releasing system ATP-binding protein
MTTPLLVETATPLVEARNAGLAYATRRGSITAVDAVSLRIAPGECVAICGRSGSGKSTLLALLGGLCAPTSGQVFFSGRPWTALRGHETQAARAEQIGFLPQESVLLPGLRALDNVMLPQLIAGRSRESASERAESLLTRVGLLERWDAYPAELSGGQQRRVALARALATEPRLLLADEPTNDLDALAEQEIVRILAELKATGTTAIVVVTHDPAVAAIADSRLWMERGRLAVNGGPLVVERPSVERPTSVMNAPVDTVAAAFELPPAALIPQLPTVESTGWWRAAIPFAVGLGVAAVALGGIDRFVAHRQQQVVETIREQRRLAEEMALQDLRADVDDVTSAGKGEFTATLFLENFRRDRTLSVLGPATGVAVQRNGRWESLPTSAGPAAAAQEIREVGADRLLIPVAFTLPDGPYDELLRGYVHVRISATMVVSDRGDGEGDLFERSDAYFIYLRDPRLTEDDIRATNGWSAKAPVPLWISMPAH